jgi:glycine dehydrogenase
MSVRASLSSSDSFVRRHVGPRASDVQAMLSTVGSASLDALVDTAVPPGIRLRRALDLPEALTESDALAHLAALASENQVMRSLIGCGYHDCITPAVIQRTILENPGWYTQYTPYQAEIAQGRLEALLNFQTMVADLTGLPLANASLLDEGTAAAEAMAMCFAKTRRKRTRFFAAADLHPQTLAVVATRADGLGIEVVVGDPFDARFDDGSFCGALLSYPTTDGRVEDYRAVAQAAHANDTLVVVAADLLALTLFEAPGTWGADIVVGTTQRFGVPLGFGGPHAAYLSTTEDYARQMPGRIIGVSRAVDGSMAYRLAIQTREQHIRRDKATSNICTAQVLLAVIAGAYAVYHGPEGLRQIAERVRATALVFAEALRTAGVAVDAATRFDTVSVRVADARAVLDAALAQGFNLRDLGDGRVSVAFDERSTLDEVAALLPCFGADATRAATIVDTVDATIATPLARTTPYLEHEVFHSYRSEHELLRYLHRLQAKDLSLTTSMIPLGSCTMKLNAAAEMMPVTMPGFGKLHPFAPPEQTRGYQRMFDTLERWLAEITGFAAVSLQPNAGSQGEYTGLMVIRAWHHAQGNAHRDVCLIPVSAHGTNPASAVIAGFKVVAVQCDSEGNIDLADLRAKAEKHREHLAALMITYPSTHGVFETEVREACDIIHQHGGQVYLDGANMNAQVGLCRPGDYGADVCHLNLHKTFCIPHGGGGPGMGPIGVVAHLAPYLPGHPLRECGGAEAIGPVSAAPYGSPSILPISYTYIAMMGPDGLRHATEVAILNANYMAARLRGHYDILFTGNEGRVAHEFVLDLRPFKASAGVDVEDVAKRLMDYGFHAPTMSWPVPGTLMVEPTESESKDELDRFCDAMIAIREEIRQVEAGQLPRENNPLKHAPHTMAAVLDDAWDRPYSREVAAFPAAWVRAHKFWPSVARIDNAFGDRHLMCTCPSVEDVAAAE